MSAEHPRASSDGLIRHEDGRVELADDSEIKHSRLYNHDLAPIPVARRTWRTHDYAALWVAMSACITTYMLSSGLIASGMNWWQALLTIFLGNIVVLAPILLNSHPGTKYGIPFPVLARASYGTVGSNLPALMRAVVACGWFGIQAWIGGQALFTLGVSITPAFRGALGGPFMDHTPTEWLCFAIFWGLNIAVIYRGMGFLKKIEGFAAPFVVSMTALLVIWAVSQAHGLGYLMTPHNQFHSLGEFLPVFIPSLTAMIGYWATLSLNMPDFTRFGRSQTEQTIGQVLALPTAMTVFSAMGVMITSAAVIIYPAQKLDVLWDPIKLIGLFDKPWVVAAAMLTVAVATLSVNIAANVVSPANDFANAFPRWISFRTGGLITGIFGIVMQPWRLLADPSGYIFAWLVGYSGGLGSIAGVLIVDYWIIRRERLALADLYLADGVYRYQNGWNWKAVAATAAGCIAAWIGLIVPLLKPLYQYAWFVGLTTSAVIYRLLSRIESTAAEPAHQRGGGTGARAPLR
jgi:NCS1 family nucleobase:cation symporter-1